MAKERKEKKKLDTTQKAMVIVSVLGGFAGICAGGYAGYRLGWHNGFIKGFDANWESIKECVELGGLKLLDGDTGVEIPYERLKQITPWFD